MRKYYRSNRSILIGLFLWGSLISSFTGLRINGSFNLEPNRLIIWSMIFLFIGTLWFGIGYAIKDNQLLIKLGPITVYRVNVMDIEAVSRSFIPLSSPAASLKRIYIKSRNGNVLISPINELEFIETLQSINPKIHNRLQLECESRSVFHRIFYWLL